MFKVLATYERNRHSSWQSWTNKASHNITTAHFASCRTKRCNGGHMCRTVLSLLQCKAVLGIKRCTGEAIPGQCTPVVYPKVVHRTDVLGPNTSNVNSTHRINESLKHHSHWWNVISQNLFITDAISMETRGKLMMRENVTISCWALVYDVVCKVQRVERTTTIGWNEVYAYWTNKLKCSNVIFTHLKSLQVVFTTVIRNARVGWTTIFALFV
jgi:hypothetical protein